MIKNLKYIIIFYFIFIFNVHTNELKINSDRLEVDRKSYVSIFFGNVHAYNQDIKIWSDKLVVKFDDDDNEILELSAENNVKITNLGITAIGDTGVYYPDNDTINIYGNVEVFEKDNYVKCDELFLDIKNATSIMKSNSSKRVEAFIINN